MSSTALSLGPRASAGLRHTLLTQFSVPSMQATSDTYPLLGGERPGEPEPLGGSFGSFDSECPKALTSLCWPKDIFNGDLRLAGYVFTHKHPQAGGSQTALNLTWCMEKLARFSLWFVLTVGGALLVGLILVGQHR